MNIIETQDLTRRYGRTEAVEALTFAVPERSVFALLGANGAGKSTTLKLLMNLIQPTRGSAAVLGVDSRLLGERELARIGYVSEGQRLPEWMTVRQLLDFCRPLYPTWDRDLERTLLRRFDLPEERRISQLSRGMAMKASLLSSLAYRPSLLVLDEPFSGLDPVVREDFIRGVLEVSAQGEWTVLISSHDMEEVERLADHVAVLDAGRLRLNETTEALQRRFRRVEITFGVGSPLAGGDDAGWKEVERAGRCLRFVCVEFAGPDSEAALRMRFAGQSVSIQPMTLREIYLVVARELRGRKEAE